jgi:general secretion pathway protein G
MRSISVLTNKQQGVKMKKGFTMIELIFVIVILGILAAVAIPRLAATRTDAQVSAAAADIATLYTDLGSYYTAQGQWADGNSSITAAGLKKMTNVASAYVSSTNIIFGTDNNTTQCLTLTLTTDGNVSTSKASSGTVCAEVIKLSGVTALTDNNQSFGGTHIAR